MSFFNLDAELGRGDVNSVRTKRCVTICNSTGRSFAVTSQLN